MSTFLVADDDAAICNLVQMLLELQGHDVLCAANGSEALDLFRNSKDPVELVITDVDMPEMNGIELVDHILQERPNTPVLVISGHTCIRGFPFLAGEPFAASDFYAAVEQAIGRVKQN